MKSYMKIWFNSEGALPSDVNSRLMSLGFEPIQGDYDYVYDWKREPKIEEILALADKVHLTLKGMKVLFKLKTDEIDMK